MVVQIRPYEVATVRSQLPVDLQNNKLSLTQLVPQYSSSARDCVFVYTSMMLVTILSGSAVDRSPSLPRVTALMRS